MAIPLQYWKADPHQRGPGEVHVIDEDGLRTLCGKLLAECPGRHIPADGYTCKACASVISSRKQRETREREEQERRRARQTQQQIRLTRRAEKRRTWQRRLEAYLRSPEWAEKRAAALESAGHICQACKEYRATEVQHLTHAHLGNEQPLELRVLCGVCQERLSRLDQLVWRVMWYEAS